MAARKWLLLASVLLLLFGAGVIAWRNVTFKLSVATPSDVGRELNATLHALGRDMLAHQKWVRLTRTPVPSLEDARRALAEGRVNLAILRSDQTMPPGSSVLAILRRETVFLLAPPGSKFDSFADLRGKTVGYAPGPAEDLAIFDKILAFYGVPADTVARVRLQPLEVADAVKSRRIAAMLILGEPGTGVSAETYAALVRAGRTAPVVIGAEEADALASDIGGVDSGKIPKGAFRGAAPDEEKEAPTLEYRLVAGPDLSNLFAGEVARMLLAAKANMINDPAINGVEAPDTEQSTYPIHPGARAYFDGEPPSLLDSFETYFWLGWAAIGILGSAATWLIGRLQAAREADRRDLHRLALLLGEARQADRGSVARLREDFEEIVEQLVKMSESGKLSSDEIATYQLALGLVRDVIERREARFGQRFESLDIPQPDRERA